MRTAAKKVKKPAKKKAPAKMEPPSVVVPKISMGFATCVLEVMVRRFQSNDKIVKAIFDEAEHMMARKLMMTELGKML